MTIRVTAVDASTRSDHYYLTQEDHCFYLGEYTARKGFEFSGTNNFISNFKKKLDKKGKPGWHYKAAAIAQAIEMMAAQAWRPGSTVVPIPPSAAHGDPMYDDRLCQVLAGVQAHVEGVDFRELIVQSKTVVAAHTSTAKRKIDALVEIWSIDEALAEPEPSRVYVFDDLLTTGAHFKAAQRVLLERFPEATVTGVFLARRAPEPDPD